jgi:non-ribosomal peptide synthetase component F
LWPIPSSASRLPLLSPTERAQLLALGEAPSDPAAPANLLTRLEAQAAQQPEALAVLCEGQSLTYEELHTRANQLARYVQALGIRHEQPVGLCMDRSLDLVVGLLAILKAGAVYVPLDPTYPTERLAFLLADARLPVVLTHARLAPRLTGEGRQVVCLDTDWPRIAQQDSQPPAVAVDPAQLAYILYTSGSTGQPKGAMNTHQGLSNRLMWMQAAYSLTPGDRVLQKTPISFDVSLWELLWPLLTGARLVLARPEGHRDSAYLVAG